MIYNLKFLKLKLKKFSRMLSIPRRYLVLDVGSGNAPFPRADVLVDKYFYDTDRVGHIVIDRPMVIGDINSLPFKDKSFDFIYCSHVLEHTDDPVAAAKELCRAGKSGYIEVPSEFQEKIQSTPVHKWYVRKESQGEGEKEILVFRPKEKEIFDNTIQSAFRKLIDSNDHEYFSFFFAHNYDLFNIEYYWKDKIEVSVENNPLFQKEINQHGKQREVTTEEILSRIADDSAPDKIPAINSILKTLVKKFFTYKNKFNLEDIIACPACKTPLTKTKDRQHYICGICSRRYPITSNGIPVLLIHY